MPLRSRRVELKKDPAKKVKRRAVQKEGGAQHRKKTEIHIGKWDEKREFKGDNEYLTR